MAMIYETDECFPKPISFGALTIPAPEARHEACPGKQTRPGILGGWVCPCPCHRKRQVR